MSMAAPERPLALEGRPTAQVIADHLRDQIVQRSIRPGQQINESFLAEQLNTSRGPLREALQRFVPGRDPDQPAQLRSVRQGGRNA
ncbi:GntR family transcriptional regulator [Pseudarthrobacter sp. NPDC055928]|uniref:GntR family transcriptional regulator n=1 Tax=Pseudarthrobacter sp. NPDC055928 TaxID=3345661 RepID=UPI0035E0632C